MRSCSWSEVQRIAVIPVSRWPEWSRWASFCTVTCVTGRWPHPDSVTSPEVLLVRPADVARAQATVDAAARRHAGGLSAATSG